LKKILIILIITNLLGGEGKVIIDSHPTDVSIYIDGIKKMTTLAHDDMVVLLEEGNHTIKAKKAKWHTQSESIIVSAKTAVKVFFVLEKKEMTDEDKQILAKKDIKKLARFKRVSEVVNDTKLGLSWQDDSRAKSVEKTWDDAKKYCFDLSLDGYDDWRMPSYTELLSIVDYDRDDPAIMPSFQNTTSYDYWFFSLDMRDSSRAWYIFFHTGSSFQDDKSSKFHIRCVRSR
jgi:hypothetical protein